MSEMLVRAARERISSTPEEERSWLAVFPSTMSDHVVVVFDQTAVSRSEAANKIGTYHRGNLSEFDDAMRERGLM